jgi:hypothetical protein
MAKRVLDRQKIYDKLMHGKTYKTYSRVQMILAIICAIYMYILWNDERTVNITLEKWKKKHMIGMSSGSWTKYKVLVNKVADKLGSEDEA